MQSLNKTSQFILLSLIITALVGSALVVPAHAMTLLEDDSPALIAPLVQRVLAVDDKDDDKNSKKSDDSKQKDAADDNSENTTTIAPATTTQSVATTTKPVATTTPAEQREVQSQKDQPRENARYDRILENILNQVIEPEKPIAENVKNQPSIVPVPLKKVATTTATTKPTQTATTTATSTSTTTDDTATTTPAGTFSRTTDGGSNQFAPLNYYIPFDNLTAEMTYGLSALAMFFGILGAVFILREPRTGYQIQANRRWVPTFGEQSLLEP